MNSDYISRQAVLDLIEHYNSDGLGSVFYGYDEGVKFAKAVNKLPSVSPLEPRANYRAFAEWVAKEVFSDIWELNKDSFQEIACRKLAKLGLVETEGDYWVLKKEVEE